MSRFFRQTLNNLFEKEKIRKYLFYAMGEIALIVIGILLALQINNWNESRKADQEEQKILKILKSEFQYNKTELERNFQKATLLSHRADSILTLYRTPIGEIDRTVSDRLIRSLSAYSTYDPSDGALTDLVGSGRLNLIKNDSLRLFLSRWFGEVQDVKEDEAYLISFGYSQMNPIRLEYLTFNIHSRLDKDSKAIFNDHAFENIVYMMSRNASYIAENYHLLDKEISRILELIDMEIKT